MLLRVQRCVDSEPTRCDFFSSVPHSLCSGLATVRLARANAPHEMTGWKRWVESMSGDLDNLLPYRTPRTVKIRDCRLGVGLLALQLGILGYVVGYQLAYNQQYKVEGDVIATSRMSLQRPDAAYRWADGSAPYCVGGNGSVPSPGVSPYVINPTGPGTYAYTGQGGVPAPQLPCLMMDELYAVPQSIERDAIFLTTRLTTSTQTAGPLPACATLSHEYCTWQSSNTTDYFVADAEFFTLLVDHSMYAPDAGITRTVRQMSGKMKVRPPPTDDGLSSKEDRDASAPAIDPCVAYTSSGYTCPPYVNVGEVGESDIFPLKTLLQAAGLPTLDRSSAYNTSETLRVGGVVLVLEVQYSNYLRDTGSWDGGEVSYTYWVTAVPASEYKAVDAVAEGASASNPTPPTRTVYNRHGVRVVLSFSGRIGSFNAQAFLINLFVSLGLLGVANALMEWIIFFAPLPENSRLLALLCGKSGGGTFVRMRHVYRQYKERVTVDFGDVIRSHKLDAGALDSLLARFASNPHLLEPLPEVFAPVLALQQASSRGLVVTVDRGGGGVGRGGGGGTTPHATSSTPILSSSPPSGGVVGNPLAAPATLQAGTGGGPGVSEWGVTAGASARKAE